jgi:hypothetical protein
MMRGAGLEELKEIFKDTATHLALGQIRTIAVSSDRSNVNVLVAVFPDQRESICRLSWDLIGSEGGAFLMPDAGDLVIVGFPDRDEDGGVVLKRLSNREDKIPQTALDGSLVLKSKPGKKVWVTASDKIFLSNGDSAPSENLVLGQQLKTLLAGILTELKELGDLLANHTHTVTGVTPGLSSLPTQPPLQSASITSSALEFDNLKSSQVESEQILSSFAFTEKG